VLDNNNVFAIDPTSGDRSILSPNQNLGVSMEQGVIDPSVRRMIVADGFHGLLEVDLANGLRKRLVAPDDAGKGPSLRAESVAVDFSRNVGYVADSLGRGIMACDLSTGERVIVSR
jgi:DNA-binding beta-propeller fold protein YncE